MLESVSVIRIGMKGFNNMVNSLASDGYCIKIMLDKKCIMVNRLGNFWYKCYIIGK